MFSAAAFLFRLLGRTQPVIQGAYRGLVSTQSHGGQLQEMVRSFIPPLTYLLYKGKAGRIGIVGGCKEYTGAPYFAAISIMKVGGDLSHVFCSEGAAPIIKSYSPELIVHPVLDSADCEAELGQWFPKLHAVVLGPGLGRDPKLFGNVKIAIRIAKELHLPLVLDADSILLISDDPDVIRNYTRAILTPNAVEFNRLYEAVVGGSPSSENPVESVTELSRALGHVTIVRKGAQDIISDGNNVLVCSAEGSPRRCGGQGDLLAGSMGVFSYWAHQAVTAGSDSALLREYGPCMAAAYAACLLTRHCSSAAYRLNGRATLTTDLIQHVGKVFAQLYEDPSKL